MQKRGDRAQEMQTSLQLILADGSTHPFAGRVQNTVNQVDSKTGTLELQATFPNPKHTILPGQFGRVRMTQRKTERCDSGSAASRSGTAGSAVGLRRGPG